MSEDGRLFDVLVIGGGINGVGIARDAAGRGLRVLLCERRDLAAATSSASSKLIHGGLRYLEHGELRLVRESLIERETLLHAAPHLIRPLRFVLPVHPGLRPAWMLRAGLFLYDHLGGRELLPATRTLRRGRDAALDPLRQEFRKAFEYSDCWADDSRLVAINALDAAERGAEILVGWALTHARRDDSYWVAELTSDRQQCKTVRARCLINAAGPWVANVIETFTATNPSRMPRLVKGSHIVVPRVYEGAQAYTFQNADKRICFMIPYEECFTLIGTTDITYDGDPEHVAASAAEIRYLCSLASSYLEREVIPRDVVWTYSGVRPLYDDGSVSASTVTRDYVFDVDAPRGRAPLLSVFGGKLTTYRKLAEHALRELPTNIGFTQRPWTRLAALPGGDIPHADFESFAAAQVRRFSWAPAPMIRRLAQAYGTRLETLLGGASSAASLGECFAPGVYEAELDYLKAREWARSADDVLWRRSKLGLHLNEEARSRIARWFGEEASGAKWISARRTGL